MVCVESDEGVCDEGGLKMGRFEGGGVELAAQLEVESSGAGG